MQLMPQGSSRFVFFTSIIRMSTVNHIERYLKGYVAIRGGDKTPPVACTNPAAQHNYFLKLSDILVEHKAQA